MQPSGQHLACTELRTRSLIDRMNHVHAAQAREDVHDIVGRLRPSGSNVLDRGRLSY